MKIYLCGAITYYWENKELYKAMDWRIRLRKKLEELNKTIGKKQFKCFDPTYNYKDNLEFSSMSVVLQNKHYLDQCDLMVVNADDLEHSPGSMFEIFYYYIKQKPVIAFGSSKIISQPHVECSISEHVIGIKEVVNYLHNMYLQ